MVTTNNSLLNEHRRMSRGGGAKSYSPLESGEAVIFPANAIFRAEASSQNDIFCIYLTKTPEFIPSSQSKCLKSGIFTNNYWVGMSRAKQFRRLAQQFSSGSVKIFFGQRQPSLHKKLACTYAYVAEKRKPPKSRIVLEENVDMINSWPRTVVSRESGKTKYWMSYRGLT